ncbi:hypothetical protein [Gordonia rhizosphera]|nr:hypothetical protein [Gordonia rhizosphera]
MLAHRLDSRHLAGDHLIGIGATPVGAAVDVQATQDRVAAVRRLVP